MLSKLKSLYKNRDKYINLFLLRLELLLIRKDVKYGMLAALAVGLILDTVITLKIVMIGAVVVLLSKGISELYSYIKGKIRK